MGHDPRKNIEPPDLSEKGGMRNGQPQRSDERLFMQLLAYGGCRNAKSLGEALEGAGVEGAVYEDANDPHGVAILTVTKDPNFFVNTVRPLLNGESLATSLLQSQNAPLWPSAPPPTVPLVPNGAGEPGFAAGSLAR